MFSLLNGTFTYNSGIKGVVISNMENSINILNLSTFIEKRYKNGKLVEVINWLTFGEEEDLPF